MRINKQLIRILRLWRGKGEWSVVAWGTIRAGERQAETGRGWAELSSTEKAEHASSASSAS